MLGAEVNLVGSYRPAFDQRLVANKVADILEACSDEWLNGYAFVKGVDGKEGEVKEGGWQEGPITADFCKLMVSSSMTPDTSCSFLRNH